MSSVFQFERVVIGAGVVGLAVARACVLAGRSTLLVEAAVGIGTGISSRSSEVIHAGMYYVPGSLKARMCARGNKALYDYGAARGVPLRRLGKLIVASTEEEVATLHRYRQRATENGVEGLVWLGQGGVQTLEPELRVMAGLFSPSTGIIDSHALMVALQADFIEAGGVFVARTPMLGGHAEERGVRLQLGGATPCEVVASGVVNAAGMGAPGVAASLRGFPAQLVPSLHFAVGHYFGLRGAAPFRHLVYPVATMGGLGIHLTLDLAGKARFGPDLSWRDTEDYAFDAARAASFYPAIRRYWPALPDGALVPAYTGIRPKLWGPLQPDQDFLIQGPEQHGIDVLVNLFGMESPGLTASLTVADYVVQLLDGVRAAPH